METTIDRQNNIEKTFIANNVKNVLTVPCSILNSCYKETPGVNTIYLSREEEGVGLASGFTVSGNNSVLMIQNSGLGNCINAFASLTIPYKIGFIVIVSMRGDDLEDNPVQVPMGKATKNLIKAIDCNYIEVSKQNSFEECYLRAIRQIEIEKRPVFILLPRLEVLL